MYQEFPLFLHSPLLEWSRSWCFRSMFIAESTLLWIKWWYYVGGMHKEPNVSKVQRLPPQVKGSLLFHPWFNKLKSVNRDLWSPAYKSLNKYHSLGLSQHRLGLNRKHERTSNADIIPACIVQEIHGSPISSHPVTQFQSGWSGSMRVCPKGCPGGNEVMETVWVGKMRKTMLFCLCLWPILQLELRFYCWEWLHWDTFWSSLWTPTLLEVWCSYKSSYTHVLFKTP